MKYLLMENFKNLIMKTNGTGIEIDIICEANLKTENTGDKRLKKK